MRSSTENALQLEFVAIVWAQPRRNSPCEMKGEYHIHTKRNFKETSMGGNRRKLHLRQATASWSRFLDGHGMVLFFSVADRAPRSFSVLRTTGSDETWISRDTPRQRDDSESGGEEGKQRRAARQRRGSGATAKLQYINGGRREGGKKILAQDSSDEPVPARISLRRWNDCGICRGQLDWFDKEEGGKRQGRGGSPFIGGGPRGEIRGGKPSQKAAGFPRSPPAF